MKIIERFEIPYYQYLNEEYKLNEDGPKLAKDVSLLINLYRSMVLIRLMDTKAIALQRTGKLGTYPSTRGQEAVFVGVGSAMANDDIFVPYYRDMATLVQRGVRLSQIFQYWGGDERGNVFTKNKEDFPFSVPVGSQGLHAAGVAYAVKYFHENRAVVTMCGDGATSQGDFYEAINVAGIWNLPVVFVICNNQWAISVARARQTKAATLAQKAIAAGIRGEQIDGNDIIAVKYRTEEAIKRAREQGEASLLEMVCYRHHDHTTADDASRYEPKDIREIEWKKEPIARLRHYLESVNAWDEQKEEELRITSGTEVDAAVAEYLSCEPQGLDSLFDYLYAQLPKAYEEQKTILKSFGANT